MSLRSRLFNSTFTIFLFANLSGCVSTPYSEIKAYQQTKHFELVTAVNIKKDKARVYIQNQQLQPTFDRYQRHCRLETSQIQQHNLTLTPQVLKVDRIQIDEEAVAKNRFTQPNNIQLAYNGDSLKHLYEVASADDSQSEPLETMDLVHFYFEKNHQGLYRLTCAGKLSNGDPIDDPEASRPSINEINALLTGIARIY
jgi:hypothetical protein